MRTVPEWRHRMLATILALVATVAGCSDEKMREPVALHVTPEDLRLREGESVQLHAFIEFSDGSSVDVTSAERGTLYETSQAMGLESAIRVTPDGVVTARSARGMRRGETILAANQGYGLSSFFTMTVVPREALEVSAPTEALRIGESLTLTVQQRLEDGSMLDLTSPDTGTTYFSPRESVATVSESGVVTAVSTRGKASRSVIIMALNGSLTGSIRLVITAERLE